LEIDNELVHRHLPRNLADFDQFAKSIIDYLEEPRDQSCGQ
jgi:uncharacterized protein YutE (UPF0331/DUF86 family)